MGQVRGNREVEVQRAFSVFSSRDGYAVSWVVSLTRVCWAVARVAQGSDREGAGPEGTGGRDPWEDCAGCWQGATSTWMLHARTGRDLLAVNMGNGCSTTHIKVRCKDGAHMPWSPVVQAARVQCTDREDAAPSASMQLHMCPCQVCMDSNTAVAALAENSAACQVHVLQKTVRH